MRGGRCQTLCVLATIQGARTNHAGIEHKASHAIQPFVLQNVTTGAAAIPRGREKTQQGVRAQRSAW